ncbi:MAG: outer membrane lipoprotein-sorting protein [Myxococcota bacterium]
MSRAIPLRLVFLFALVASPLAALSVSPARADAPAPGGASSDAAGLLARALVPERLGFRAGEATLSMQLRDAAGRIVERTLRARTIAGSGWRKTRLTFLEPIDQKGVELLVVEKKGAGAEQTLWLPRARELRKIGSSDRGARLQGSDFTFEDFESKDLARATITRDGEETLGGVVCERLAATGLPGRWAKVVFWVARDQEIPVRIDFLQGAAGGDAALARRFEVKRLQQIGGQLTPTRMVMSDELAGTRTTLDLSGFRDERFPDSMFLPEALGQ